jgi:hypothetical protein
MKRTLSVACLCLAAGLIGSSCKKQLPTEKVTVAGKSQDGPIPTYVFDWTTATYAPTSPANVVNMPWNSGSNPIDIDLVNDYLPADGWRLVWSTFSPTQVVSGSQVPLYFALYNVYRGLLRFYLYEPASALATTNVVHGLNLYNQTLTSPMLNFNGKTIVDNGANQTVFSQAVTRTLNLNNGTWYVFQYEIAYDPNNAATSFPGPTVPQSSTQALEWKSQWASVTQASFNGTVTGTIVGTAGEPQSVLGSFFNAGGVASSAFTQLLGLGSLSGAGSVFQQYINTVNNAMQNQISSLVNGVLGTTASGNTVNLVLNANISLTGSLVTNGGLEDVNLILPGQQNSQTGNGLTPVYNSTMGVFTVVGVPQVQIHEDPWSITFEDPYDGSTQTDYGVNATVNLTANSVNVQFNPAIINSDPVNGCHVANYTTQLLVDDYPIRTISHNYTLAGPGTYPSPLPSYDVYSNSSASNPAVFSYYTQIDPNEGGIAQTPKLYVRVSFDLVTNNGNTRKATIVKTFLANQL